MEEEPSQASIHATRAFIEAAFPPENDQLKPIKDDDSGLHLIVPVARGATA